MVVRQETERNLRGRNSASPLEFSSGFNLSSPAPLSVSGAGNARGVQAPEIDTMSRVMGGLAEFGSKKIREAAAQRYSKQAMEGAMAQTQGEAIEAFGGFEKRWQLEGYRQMEAGTAAAALLSAQKQEIAQGLYEADPDEFRRIQVNRLEMATQGKDERVVDIITRQMMEQMPTLVAEHTAQNMAYLNRQSVSALETSIDVMSRAPESTTDLLAYARGEAGSAGLSTEARRGAVISGIARAYDNDNPAAYAILNNEGVLGEMSSEELGTVRAAQARFEQRRRSEYDEDFFNAEQSIIRDIEEGQFLDPMDAINAMSQLYTDRGITLSAAEAGQVYNQTDNMNEIHHSATALSIATAQQQGDYAKIAELTGPYIVHIESRGRRDAVSPTGAKSEWQVMDDTNLDPGFGVRPARNNTLEERARVGRDYWAAMVARYEGDLELAGIAYNAGPGRADAFIAAGRNYDALPAGAVREQARGYVRQINALVGGETYANRASNRLAAAREQAEIVREAAAVDLYAQITPQLSELDRLYQSGAIDETGWRATRQVIRDRWGVEQSVANVNTEIAVHNSRLDAEIARASAGQDEEYKVNLDLFKVGDVELQTALSQAIRGITDMPAYDNDGTPIDANTLLIRQREMIEEATTEYLSAQAALGQQFGIKTSDLGLPGTARYIADTMTNAMDAALANGEQLHDIRVATERGTLSTLDRDSQDRAWNEFQDGITKRYANMPPAATAQEESDRADAFASEIRGWYSRTGYVPPEVREQASAALTAQMVNEDGEPSEYAIEAAQEYIALKGQSQHAASQFLNPDAQVVAEAILSITGGRTNTIPQTIQRIHAASGYSSTGAKQVDPDFISQSSVQRAISVNVERGKARGFFAEIFGGRGAGLGTRTGAGADASAALTRAIEQRVAAIHSINPNIPPQHVVDMATDSVQQQMAVIAGELIIDPTGRDMYYDVFGNQANEFRSDPNSISRAVHSYLRSDNFADYVPSLGLMDRAAVTSNTALTGIAGMFGATELVAGINTRQMAGAQGVTSYTVEAVGNGNLIVNFDVDGGSPISVPIRLQDVGAHFKAEEFRRRTE